MKSWSEIRKDAAKFAHRWKGAYDEKSQAARGLVGFISSRASLRLGRWASLRFRASLDFYGQTMIQYIANIHTQSK